jgi:hypothetical protein
MYYVRFNYTHAFFVRQLNEFSQLTKWVQECLFKNKVGLDLHIKVVKDGEAVFLVIVIGISSFDELTVLDQEFIPGTALWADAGIPNLGTFDQAHLGKHDCEFSFMTLPELREMFAKRDSITKAIDGLFKILEAKDKSKLPRLEYNKTLATILEICTKANEKGVVPWAQTAATHACESLENPDQGLVDNSRSTLAHLSLDKLLERCGQILVHLRQFPFTNESEGIKLLETYDPKALQTQA